MRTLIPLSVLFIYLADAQNLSVTVSFHKDTVLVGEPLLCFVSFKNESGSPIRISAPVHRVNFNIVIEGSDGRRLEYWGPVSSRLGPPETLLLQEGEEHTNYYDINMMFSEVATPYRGLRFMRPETYSFSARYETDNSSYTSNAAALTVIEPRGREGSAYGIFLEALSHASKIYDASSRASADNSFNRLLNHHSESVYSPFAIVMLSSLYEFGFKDPIRATEVRERLLTDYRQSSMVIYSLNRFLAERPTAADKRKLLLDVQGAMRNRPGESIILRELKSIAQ